MMKKNYNKKTKFKFLFLALLSLVSFNSYSADWFVDISNTGTEDGTTWGTAFNTIGEAVAAAATSGDTIFIAEGTYGDATKNNASIIVFISGKVLTLEGGYPTGGGTRDIVAHPTIIDGENARRGIFTTSSLTVKGITVDRARASNKANSAAGISGFNVTLEDVTITNSDARTGNSTTSDIQGSALRASNQANLTRCTITNNVGITLTANTQTIGAFGAGVYARGATTITDCTITDNTIQIGNNTGKTFNGAGIYTDTPDAVTISGSTITGNRFNDAGTFTNNDFGNVLLTFTGANTVEELTIDAASTVTIPAGNNSINVTGNISNSGTITVNAGASLLVAGTSTGNITYNVNVSNVNWHLVTSPVSGAQYNNTWVTDNEVHISGSNRGVSTYDNATPDPTTGPWNYYQGGVALENFESGVGYSLKKAVAAADFNYSFTGTIPTVANPAISQDDNNWNLIGNSFPSYMDIAAFITANGTSGTDKLSDAFQSIYVWNGATYSILTTGHIQPGQAFFVNSKVASSTASITKAMQSHQDPSTNAFLKSSTPKFNLSVSNGKITKSTEISYLDAQTKGLDPGFDIGMFDGVASELSVYTHLVDNNEGISFGRQALPTAEMESAIIPLGIKAIANKEITFSLSALNLPSGVNVYLENREENTFTSLTNGDVKITPQKNIDGVGIYYVRVSSKALSTETINLEGVSIYKMNNNTLKINGLSNAKASVKMFTILGKQVLNTSFDAKGNNEISLPKLTTGVYIVQLQSEQGNLNKKIILE